MAGIAAIPHSTQSNSVCFEVSRRALQLLGKRQSSTCKDAVCGTWRVQRAVREQGWEYGEVKEALTSGA